jgi:hypothetical protein
LRLAVYKPPPQKKYIEKEEVKSSKAFERRFGLGALSLSLNGPFLVFLVLSGAASSNYWVGATTGLGVYDCPSWRLECPKIVEFLNATHTTSYNFLLEDADGSSYLHVVDCLNQTAGLPFTFWITLIPPTETLPTGGCSVPANSPITPFNETKLFHMSKGYKGCEDYRARANVLGQLSLQFPHLRCVNIDDFSDNLGVFSLELVSEMSSLLHHKQSNRHSNRRGALLVPTVYYAHYLQALRLPIDGLLYYFRNDKVGTGPRNRASCPGAPCASKWPEHACLAGQCAEATTANLRSELIDVQSALSASGKELHVYTSVDSHLHHTTTVRRLLQNMVPRL